MNKLQRSVNLRFEVGCVKAFVAITLPIPYFEMLFTANPT